MSYRKLRCFWTPVFPTGSGKDSSGPLAMLEDCSPPHWVVLSSENLLNCSVGLALLFRSSHLDFTPSALATRLDRQIPSSEVKPSKTFAVWLPQIQDEWTCWGCCSLASFLPVAQASRLLLLWGSTASAAHAGPGSALGLSGVATLLGLLGICICLRVAEVMLGSWALLSDQTVG